MLVFIIMTKFYLSNCCYGIREFQVFSPVTKERRSARCPDGCVLPEGTDRFSTGENCRWHIRGRMYVLEQIESRTVSL